MNGTRLKELREQANLTQHQLADRIGFSENWVRTCEDRGDGVQINPETESKVWKALEGLLGEEEVDYQTQTGLRIANALEALVSLSERQTEFMRIAMDAQIAVTEHMIGHKLGENKPGVVRNLNSPIATPSI